MSLPKPELLLAAAGGALLATGLLKLTSLLGEQRATVNSAPTPCEATPKSAAVAATASVPAPPPVVSPSAAAPLPDAPELLAEQLSRNRVFFGEAGQAKIEGAFVVVVGLGGVGSHAAHMLARAGVGRLRLIDFDQVTLSSLNRHATATRADVGTPKVSALARALSLIIPSCKVEALQVMFTAETAEELLGGNPDYVLDCIDDRTTKAALLHTCKKLGLRTLASLGAGAKADPTRIAITDLGSVTYDAMAVELKKVLKELADKEPFPGAYVVDPTETGDAEAVQKKGKGKGKGGAAAEPAPAAPLPTTATTPGAHPVTWDTLCVYSAEPARVELLPLELAEGETAADFGAVPGFRVRVIPVLGTLPALFGQTMANYVLCALSEAPSAQLAPMTQEITGPRMAGRIAKKHQDFDEVQYGSALPLLSVPDVQYLFDTLWQARSVFRPFARTGKRKAALVLVRWRPHLPSFTSNLITADEAEAEAWATGTCAAVWPGAPRWGGELSVYATPEEAGARLSNPYAGLNPQRALTKAELQLAEERWAAWVQDLLARVQAEDDSVPFFFRGLTPARVAEIEATLGRAKLEGHH